MKALQNHTRTLLISLCILGFSINSVINLSMSPIENSLSAAWIFTSIILTLAGILISPVLIVMALGNLVKNTLQPERKVKQKNHN